MGVGASCRQDAVVKRYPEPMAHGPEACEPLTPDVSGRSLFSNPRDLEPDF